MYQDNAHSQQEQPPPDHWETYYPVQGKSHWPCNSSLYEYQDDAQSQEEQPSRPPDQCRTYHHAQVKSNCPCSNKVYEDEVHSVMPTDVSILAMSDNHTLQLELAFPNSYDTIMTYFHTMVTN